MTVSQNRRRTREEAEVDEVKGEAQITIAPALGKSLRTFLGLSSRGLQPARVPCRAALGACCVDAPGVFTGNLYEGVGLSKGNLRVKEISLRGELSFFDCF